jgi:GxxExxY protein
MEIEALAREAVDCGFKLHADLGPGLLESVYELLMAKALLDRGFLVERQKSISFRFRDAEFADGFRADLLVEGRLLIEVKSVDKIAAVHGKQVLTYLRLMDLPLGLLMNFGGSTFKEGVRRIVNNHFDTASSALRIHDPHSTNRTT